MILDTLNLIREAANIFFTCSYKIGKFIVSTLFFIGRCLYVTTEKLSDLLKIVVGDFELFVQDVSRTARTIVNLVCRTYNLFLWIVDRVILNSIEYLILFGYGIRTFITNVYSSLQTPVTFINDLFQQIGLAIWYLITLPITVFHMIESCIYSLKFNLYDLYIKAKSFSVEAIYSSWKLMPAESCVRMIIISIFVYLLLRFRKLLRKICKRTIRFIFSYIYWKIIKFQWRFKKPISENNEANKSSSENYLCIICQADPRCIVLMPCRHLCLCDDCSNKLVRYQTDNCPVCRQKTNFRIKVYL